VQLQLHGIGQSRVAMTFSTICDSSPRASTRANNNNNNNNNNKPFDQTDNRNLCKIGVILYEKTFFNFLSPPTVVLLKSLASAEYEVMSLVMTHVTGHVTGRDPVLKGSDIYSFFSFYFIV
jgi:hypothetical protein